MLWRQIELQVSFKLIKSKFDEIDNMVDREILHHTSSPEKIASNVKYFSIMLYLHY